MDITEITTIISTVGFPIAACVVMWVQNGKLQGTLAQLSETLAVISERLSDVEDAVKKGDK